MTEDTITLTLPVEPLRRLRAVWEKGLPDSHIVLAVRDLFDGRDGYLHALLLPQLDRAFNDPIMDCCGRDAADCDCPVTMTNADYLTEVEDMEAEPERCPVCGEFPDYCQGHGEIGDPEGYALLVKYDAIADVLGVSAEQVGQVDQTRHSARPFTSFDTVRIAQALDAYDKENRHV